MSAKFIWVRNPTAINGLATTYVSLRGSDTNGDGTAQNPYRSLAKATTMAAASTNIMLDDGVWREIRNSNSNSYNWFGNAKTFVFSDLMDNRNRGSIYRMIILGGINIRYSNAHKYYYYCYINVGSKTSSQVNNYHHFSNCIIVNSGLYAYMDHCICLDWTIPANYIFSLRNSIVNIGAKGDYNNYLNQNIPAGSTKCINNSSTGQTLVDYFNHYNANFLIADFTAKAGSANIGAGENGSTIGLNQGYPARATNDSNDIFAAANGATLRNVAWNATLNGYSLVHKDKVCAGYTVNTITLAADAETIDDYYNGLFIGITAGNGYGEIHRITDYDGTTKIATIDSNWTTQPDTQSVYSITGTIDSATKDFGRVIKVKRNWAFLANMQSWTAPNDSSYGMWKEFLTSPLQNNGEWMMRPCSNFRYEYSLNGTEWYSNTELLAGTDSENKTDNAAYGNASESYVAANAKTTVLRYVRYHIQIGFNIGEDA